MKRPELSDLLPHAGFEARGRDLYIAIPEAHDTRLNSVFSTAVAQFRVAVLQCRLVAGMKAILV